MLHVSLKEKMSHFWAREHNMLNGLISDNTKLWGPSNAPPIVTTKMLQKTMSASIPNNS